jgi:hypothetical protein
MRVKKQPTPMLNRLLCVLALVVAILPVRGQLLAPNALNLIISANATHEIPATLYGYMWEVRSAKTYSIDPGLNIYGPGY